MKKLLTETTKVLTLLCCVFVMFSCGGNDCQTCTLEGSEDMEVCEDDFPDDVLSAQYNAAILANEALGYECE